jgi:hypothetical protein
VTAGSNTVCRPAAGDCDVDETCDGVAVACPTNVFSPSTQECRASAGICDVADNCTGSSANCPANVFQPSSTICRPGTDTCDATELCTGSAAACPSDGVLPSTVVCRADAGDCDVVDNCDGTNKACPPDEFEPANATCDDGSFCTFNDACDGNGGCTVSSPVDCDDVNPCTDDSCDSQGGGFLCEHDNNGICIGANCGNFVVDPGESCDPPNLAPNPQGQTTCRLDCTSCGDGVVQAQNNETCDDGNLVSGCRPDQPQRPLDECLNNCNRAICDDPARISFKRDQDLLKFHGRLISEQSVDLGAGHFVIELRDVGDNVLYRASVTRSTIVSYNGTFRYKNRNAKLTGGLYTMKAKYRDGYYLITLKAYGDLSATIADMVTHVYSGSSEWAVRGTWTAVGPNAVKGWKLGKGDVFLPVP